LDLSKISWSRSSRTDKGVHAARIVFSGKLELPVEGVPANPHAQPLKFPDVVKNVNQFLPEHIQLFSCMKINHGFVARDECYWREYEYLLPVELISDDITKPLEGKELQKTN